MSDAPPHPAAEDADVEAAYRLVLGRGAEEGVRRHFHGRDLTEIVSELILSPEFDRRIEAPLDEGAIINVEPQARAALGAAARWAAARLPLAKSAAMAARRAVSWERLLETVLVDAALRDALTEQARSAAQRVSAKLAARAAGPRARLAGAVESAGSDRVTGWAIDLAAKEQPLTLHLYVDGRIAGVARTGLLRRDLQDVFGGHGRYGFAVVMSARTGRGEAVVEVREAESGLVVGRGTVRDEGEAAVEALAFVQDELRQVKASLARLEAAIPDLRRLASFPLAAWDRYWRRFYADVGARPSVEAGSEAPRVTVIASAPADPESLRRLLESFADPLGRYVLLAQDNVLNASARQRIDEAQKRLGERLRLRLCDPETSRAAMRNAAAQEAATTQLIFCEGAVPAAEALSVIGQALSTAPDSLVFADGDVLLDGSEERHVAPALRSGMDYELLLQQGFLGPLWGIGRESFAAVGGFDRNYEPAQDHDFWLRFCERYGAASIIHVPRVLSHAFARPGPSLAAAEATQGQTERCVEAHLSRIGRPAGVTRHSDALAPSHAATARLKALGLAGRKARVIIPTRDRFDLLGSCLASLERSREHNECGFETLIVDNRSDPALAAAAFPALRERFAFEVLAFDGEFNWAAINNLAARDCAAEALVFLNNDTEILSPDWCDALVGYALLPHVGAVGARLLFANGAIQHAGMVIGANGLPVHEGEGEPGHDGGYLGRHAVTRECFAVTGACLCTRTEVFQSLGGFDAEAFAVTYNDVDYCFRARREGLKIVYQPYATLFHLGAISRGFDISRERAARARAEEERFRARWGELPDPFYNPHFERFAEPFTRLAPPPPLPEDRR